MMTWAQKFFQLIISSLLFALVLFPAPNRVILSFDMFPKSFLAVHSSTVSIMQVNGTSLVWLANATEKIFRDATGTVSLSTIPRESKSISLAIAKNGIDFFQVVITAGTFDLSDITITVGDLQGPGNAKIAASYVSVFLEYYVRTRSDTYYESILHYTLGEYPDALIPLRAPFSVKAGQNQPLWVEVKVPENATAGDYTGLIQFSGGISAVLSFSVKVLDIVVPSHSGLHNPGFADFWELKEVASGTNVKDLVKKYSKFFTDHDIDLGVSFDALDALPTFEDGSWNFESWLNDMSLIIDGGSLLSEFDPPTLRVPVNFNVLGVDVDQAVEQENQERYITFLKEFKEFIDSQTKYDLSEVKWYVWIDELDEPTEPLQVWLIARYAELTALVNAEIGFNYHYRVDGSIDWNNEAVKKDIGTDTSGWEDLSDRFTIWLAPQEDFEFDLSYIQKRIAEGKIVMIYQQSWTALEKGDEDIPSNAENRDYEFPSLPGIMNPALFHRILPWFAWKYKAAGIGFWAVMAWYDTVNGGFIDPFVDDPALWISFAGLTEHAQNGDGWLVYPGNKVSEHTGQPDVDGPVSSIRLELFRKGLEDYKYIRMLELSFDSFPPDAKSRAVQYLNQINTMLGTITSFDRNVEKYDEMIWNIKMLLNENAESVNSSIPSVNWEFSWNPPPVTNEPPSEEGFPIIVITVIGGMIFIGVIAAIIIVRRRKSQN